MSDATKLADQIGAAARELRRLVGERAKEEMGVARKALAAEESAEQTVSSSALLSQRVEYAALVRGAAASLHSRIEAAAFDLAALVDGKLPGSALDDESPLRLRAETIGLLEKIVATEAGR
jgi:hypothetical protein